MDNEHAWNFAIGLVRMSGGEPTKDFLELVEKEKRGEITAEEIYEYLHLKYSKLGLSNKEINN
jgi:hypothetical protein